MVAGVAEYRDPGVNNGEPYRILVDEPTIKNMDPTFDSKPVYVKHVDEVNLSEIKEADGFVVRSFFNKSDGKHWVEFLVITDRGHEAIKKGWKLSNAYLPKSFAQGGLWHGVEYKKEVMEGEYEHLAIVPDPRYSESMILTPEDFKTYNNEKEIELKKLSNEKDEGDRPMLNFFKKSVTKLENSKDLEATSVTLPKSGKEMTIMELVTEMDKIVNMSGYANGDHMVKVGEDEMSVNDLIKKYKKMNESKDDDSEKKQNEQDEKPEPQLENEDDEEEDQEKKKKNKKSNKEDDDQEEEKEPAVANKKKKNAKDEDEFESEQDDDFFGKLKNAHNKPLASAKTFELPGDQVARGKSRYGSN